MAWATVAAVSVALREPALDRAWNEDVRVLIPVTIGEYASASRAAEPFQAAGLPIGRVAPGGHGVSNKRQFHGPAPDARGSGDG